MPTITRKLEFDAGHRVLKHESKCKNLHGHRYVAEVTVKSDELDQLGRVIDFSVIKKVIGGWIDDHWDHNLILNENDPICRLNLSQDKTPYIITDGKNPTAEVMAEILFGVCVIHLPSYLTVIRIRLFETPNCWADYPDE